MFRHLQLGFKGTGDPVGTVTARFYVTNHLGTVRVEMDALGDVLTTNDYEPYGVALPPRVDTESRLKFTGQERDSYTNYDYMHFRFYASSMGRFLKPDNIIADITNPQSWNAYTYVKGNPVNFNDPSGHYGNIAGMTKETYIAPPGGSVFEATAVQYMTFSWTEYYLVTVTRDSQGNILNMSMPQYSYSLAGYDNGGVAAGGTGSSHFRNSYAGDSAVAGFLFGQLVKHLTEIVFSTFRDPIYSNLTYILYGFYTSETRKICEASRDTLVDVWKESVKFALRTGAIWETFGHVEPGIYFSSDVPFRDSTGRYALTYQGDHYAGSDKDVDRYNEYYKTINSGLFKFNPSLVILFGPNQWFSFTP